VKKKNATSKPKPKTAVKVKDLSPKKNPTGGVRKAGGKQYDY
jgi:hypothetical protein